MKRIIYLVFLFSAVSLADTATQTDWSGGGGVPGPVTDWGNSYYSSYDVTHEGDSLHLVLTTPAQYEVGSLPSISSIFATDIDGDSDVDVLGSGSACCNRDMAWWENTDGTGTSWTIHEFDNNFPGAFSVYSADVDGDGDMDVLGAAMPGGIAWWENTDGTGTSLIRHTVDDTFGGFSVYSVDVDGDGDMDVLGGSWWEGGIAWWENTDGTGTSWTKHTINEFFRSGCIVVATDVDGDGDMDVLGGCEEVPGFFLWNNTDGTGTSWTEDHVAFGIALSSIYTADVDGDGDMDALGAAEWNSTFGYILWFENTDGTGSSWTYHIVDSYFDGANSVFAADLDEDGDMDILGSAYNDKEITWWENTDGTGSSWTEHIVDPQDPNFVVHLAIAADVNGDGKIDVLGSAPNAGDVAWWDLNQLGFSSFGDIVSSILDVGTVESWDNFVFNGDVPAGTTLAFAFRSSSDSSNMGDYSDCVYTNTSLTGILADSTEFLQYQVTMQTTDPTNTPVLHDVSFVYSTYLGVADDNTCEVITWDLTPSANPSFGNFAVHVSTPQPRMVNLVLHDITGRVITQYSQNLPSGTHAIFFNNLAEGVYFCTMRAGDFTATERIVVLK